MKPARCCVLTQKGTRCANEPSPVRPVRMIGPVRLAACGLEAHQRALWSLPGFVRHDAYCGAFGCDRPSNAGICQKHRDMYRDFGITEYALLAQEAPMTEPTITPAPADDGEPSEGDIQDAYSGRWGQYAEVARLPMSTPTLPPEPTDMAALAARGQPPTAPGPTVAELQQQLAAERARADLLDDEVRRQRERADAAERDAAEERVRANEWLTQLHDAQAQLNAITDTLDDDPERSPAWDEDGNPIPLPRRVEVALMPDKPGQSRIEREISAVLDRYEAPTTLGSVHVGVKGRVLVTARALRDSRAGVDAMATEIMDVSTVLYTLGADVTSNPRDALLQVLAALLPDVYRRLMEVEVAAARAGLARLQAHVVNPPTPERIAEAAAKVATLDARIAALDAG